MENDLPPSENNQEPPFSSPESTEEVKSPQPSGHKGPKGQLELVSPEILAEIDARLLTGEKPMVVRDEFLQKYPDIKELKVASAAWLRRALKLTGQRNKKSKLTPLDEKLVKQEIAAALPTTKDLQTAVSVVVDPSASLSNKREAMSHLFDKIMLRLAVLEGRQQNYIDPQYEGLIAIYMKTAADIIEKVSKLQEVLNQDVETEMLKRQDEAIRKMFQLSYEAYTQAHPNDSPESKFDLFRMNLEGLITSFLQNQ